MPTEKPKPRTIRVNALPTQYGISAKTGYRWIAEGHLTGYKAGPRIVLIDVGELERFIGLPASTQDDGAA